MAIIPSIYIVGSPKCGTTYLAESMKNSGYIVPVKEPHFWDSKFAPNESTTKENYYKLYKDKPLDICVDASVFIIYDVEILQDIKRQNPNAIFVWCIRNPSDAAVSWLNQKLKSYRHEGYRLKFKSKKNIDRIEEIYSHDSELQRNLSRLFGFHDIFIKLKSLDLNLYILKFEDLISGNIDELNVTMPLKIELEKDKINPSYVTVKSFWSKMVHLLYNSMGIYRLIRVSNDSFLMRIAIFCRLKERPWIPSQLEKDRIEKLFRVEDEFYKKINSGYIFPKTMY